MVSKASDPNTIPNRVLKHLSQRVIFLLVNLFSFMEAHLPNLHSEIWKGPGSALVLKSRSLLNKICKLF